MFRLFCSWICRKSLWDTVPFVELRGIESIRSVLHRNKLKWFRHVQRKLDGDWVKKCMEYLRLSGPNCKGMTNDGMV